MRRIDLSGRLFRAALFAGGSKVFSVGIQILALPIAIRALEKNEFAFYTLVSGTLSWMTIFEAGLGIGLINQLVVSERDGDKRRSASAFCSSFLALTLMAICGAVLACLVLWVLAQHSSIPTPRNVISVVVCAGIAGMGMLALSCAQRVRVVYDEIYVNTALGMGANVVTLALLYWVFERRHSSSLLSFLLIMQYPLLAGSLLNLVLLLIKRNYLFSRVTFDWDHLVENVKEGVFGVLAQLGILAEREGPKIALAMWAGEVLVARFGVFVQILFSIAGILTTVTALLSAKVVQLIAAKSDKALWHYWRNGALLLIVGLCTGSVILAFSYKFIFRIWFGGRFEPGLFELMMFLAWTCTVMLNHWSYMVISFKAGLKRLAKIHFGIGVSSFAYVIVISYFGINGGSLSVLFSGLFFSGAIGAVVMTRLLYSSLKI